MKRIALHNFSSFGPCTNDNCFVSFVTIRNVGVEDIGRPGISCWGVLTHGELAEWVAHLERQVCEKCGKDYRVTSQGSDA